MNAKNANARYFLLVRLWRTSQEFKLLLFFACIRAHLRC